jgi:hypothetical protein
MVSAFPSLPPTSAAVNIQIIEPKNFSGGATAGAFGQPGAQPNPYGGQPNGQNPYGYQPQPFNPYAPPQQQLQQAYQDAMNARNAAEQARNSYMNLANNLNNQAYLQQQPYGQPNPYQPGFGQQPYGAPLNQSINFPPMPQPQPQQQPFPYPMPYFPNQPFQPGPQQWPPFQQDQQPQPAPIQPNQVPQPEPQPVQPQPQPEPVDANQPAQPPAPVEPSNPLKTMSVDDLNNFIANPATLQQKINAMEEIGIRGQGNPQTYELLKREALSDTSQLSGQALDDANYVRQASLWTMGMMNKAQNGSVPTDKLPGLSTIEKIIGNKRENPEVQAAAVQALQVINRPGDARIQKILKAASKNKNPEVKRIATEALAGKTIPLPN